MMRWLGVFLLALLTVTCATKRKSERRGASEPAVEPAYAGESSIGSDTGVEPRATVDPATLQNSKLDISAVQVCSTDKALKIRTSTTDPVDFFNLRICPENASTNCRTMAFGDPELLVTNPAGKYDVSLQGCLDANHTVDPSRACGDWATPQSFEFTAPSGPTVALMNDREYIRGEIRAVCTQIRGVMTTYIANESDRSAPMYGTIQRNLTYIGPQACETLLLSAALAGADDLAAAQGSGKSGSESTDKVTVSSQIMGIIFIVVGSAGFIWGAQKAYVTFRDTVAPKVLEAQRALVEAQKKVVVADVEFMKLQVVEFDDILQNLIRMRAVNKKMDFAHVPGEADLRGAIEDYFLEAGVPRDRITSLEAELRPFIDTPDPAGLWKKLVEIDARLAPEFRGFGGWGFWTPLVEPPAKFSLDPFPAIKRFVGRFVGFAPFASMKNFAAERLYRHVEHLEVVAQIKKQADAVDLDPRTPAEIRDGRPVSKPPDLKGAKPEQIREAVIQARDARIAQIVELDFTMTKYYSAVASGAYAGGAEGAKFGGAIGGAFGALPVVGGVGTAVHGMVVGAGVGGGLGAASGALEAHARESAPHLTETEKTILRSRNKAQIEALNKQFIADVAAKQQARKGIGVTESLPAKARAAALPGLAAMAALAIASIGVEELSKGMMGGLFLDGANAQKDFLDAYVPLYRKADTLRRKYLTIKYQLENGMCGT